MKKAEPILSKEVEAIVNKSQGWIEDETLYSKSDDLLRIKYRIGKILLGNDDLLRALHHPDLSDKTPLNGDAFREECVFDYLKLHTDVKTEVKNYLCYDVNSFLGNNRIIGLKLIIRIVCYDDDMPTTWGCNRVDLIDAIISNVIDWNGQMGMTMIKESSVVHASGENYYYKDLTYAMQFPNNYFNRAQK